MGKSVALAVFNTHLGGLTSGGLAATDVKHGLHRWRLPRVFTVALDNITVAERFNFEPKVARRVFEDWLAEVGVVRGGISGSPRLAGGRRITEIRMEDGTSYRRKCI